MSFLPPPKSLFSEGRTHFLSGEYFEAHDDWEELWQHLRGGDRRYLQALIQAAVGCYHLGNGNRRGAFSQFCKSLSKLAEYPPVHWGVDTKALRAYLTNQISCLASGSPEEPRGGVAAAVPPVLPFNAAGFPRKLPLAN